MKYVLFLCTCFPRKYYVGHDDKFFQKFSSRNKIKIVIKNSSKSILKCLRSSDNPCTLKMYTKEKVPGLITQTFNTVLYSMGYSLYSSECSKSLSSLINFQQRYAAKYQVCISLGDQ